MAKNRLPRYLVKRNEIFYFRIAIPIALRLRFGCTEIKHSLRTEHRDVACLHCRHLTNKFEFLFMTASVAPELNQDQLVSMAKSYFRELLITDNDRIFWIEEMWGNQTEDRVEAVECSRTYEKWLRQQDAEGKGQTLLVEPVKKKLQESGSVALTPGSDTYKILCDYFLRAEIERSRIFQAKLQKDYAAISPIDPLFTGIMDDTLPPLPLDAGGLSQKNDLATLTHRFYEQKKSKWAYKTALDYKRVLKLVVEWFGGNRMVGSLTTQDIGLYRDMLLKLPKSKKTAGLKGYETLQLAILNPDTVELITPKTADKYLQFSKSFLYWCGDEGYIEKVPGKKVSIDYVATEKPKDPFDNKQIEIIFSSSIWSGCKSASHRSDTGTLIFKNAHYWIPLIGLYTGMRSGEIIQLRNVDIRWADDVPYFDVNEHHQKKLKTKYSNRRIPIHPNLQKWGLMTYLEKRAKAGPAERIFKEITISPNGDPSNSYSKMFSRHLTRIGIKSEKLSFHSFRHTMSDAFDNAGTIDAHRHSLMGHSSSSASVQYGIGASVPVLLEVIKKISYDFEQAFGALVQLPDASVT